MGRAITAALAALATGPVGLTIFAATAAADPYPPSQPCAVAVHDTAASADRYEVTGTGLGAVQPVRLLLATTGRTVGHTRTDSNGQFRAVVQAPRESDGTTPRIEASSAQRTCPGRPPGTTPTTPPATTVPGAPTGTPAIPPRSTAGTGGGTAGVGAPPAGTPGRGTATAPGATAPASGTSSTSATGSSSPTGSDPGSPSDTATRPGSASVSVAPRADPSPTEPSFGIGLAIAAVLLVLGTLGVLLLTRRPEH